MMNEQEYFWTEIRRRLLSLVQTLAKTRPDDNLTLEIRIVERARPTT